MKTFDRELKWKENVEKAKTFVNQQKVNQMNVAALALEVCEITWGGTQHREKYTLTKFAREIGVAVKTLSSWVAVKKRVFDKLAPDQVGKINLTQMMRIAEKIENNTPKQLVQEKVNEVIHGRSIENTIKNLLCYIRTLANHYGKNGEAKNVSLKTNQELVFYANIILKAIKKEYPDIKGIDHHIAGENCIKHISAAKALGIGRIPGERTKKAFVKDGMFSVPISGKDRDVFNFVKKKGGWVGPTEIGMIVGKHNSNSASAWAYRSLNKLLSLEMVERNKYGHYKVKEK